MVRHQEHEILRSRSRRVEKGEQRRHKYKDKPPEVHAGHTWLVLLPGSNTLKSNVKFKDEFRNLTTLTIGTT